jgi:AmiR/NasT family two-component response regulator
LRRAESELEQLHVALASRATIGIAKGVLMYRYGLDDKQAFAYLSRVSQGRNIKLRDVARQVIDELTNKHSSDHPQPSRRGPGVSVPSEGLTHS